MTCRDLVREEAGLETKGKSSNKLSKRDVRRIIAAHNKFNGVAWQAAKHLP